MTPTDNTCKTCNGPATVDFKRYPGGSFCENKGCPAYQDIPKPEAPKCERCDDKGFIPKLLTTVPAPAWGVELCPSCHPAEKEEWEERFDDKWFKTESVSKTLNQHRWMMKDFLRQEKAASHLDGWKEGVREAMERVKNSEIKCFWKIEEKEPHEGTLIEQKEVFTALTSLLQEKDNSPRGE